MALSDLELSETVELVASMLFLGAYVNYVMFQGGSVEDPYLNALLAVAILAIFGDKAKKLLPGSDVGTDSPAE